ncbi:MAG TPA: 4Fe-4S dicluster domain-containing protein, partial [Opitutaceae bacterium]|nr:4Fe-4S dicluster domain-containing protein [Opitutaceae bacterium]
PDRSREPLRLGEPASWSAFEDEWLGLRAELATAHGAGLAILTEPTTSPTLLREIRRVLKIFPGARWYQHTPLARYDADGWQPDYDFAAAAVIFSIQSDCFYLHPAAVRYGRAFVRRRRIENGRALPCRFYAAEAVPSVTGALADFRLPASPGRQPVLLNAIGSALDGVATADDLSLDEKNFVRDFVAAVRARTSAALCVAGPECEDDVRAWATAFNRRLSGGAARRLPAVRSDGDPQAAGDLQALADALGRGQIRSLFIFGANPVYTAPQNLAFAEKLGRVPFAVHLGEHADETAALCRWHLPESHFLETWSDLRAYDGTATIQQPMIEPLYATRSAAEMMRFIADPSGGDAYELVRETWRLAVGGTDFEARWHRWLDRGVVDSSASAALPDPAAPERFPVLAAVPNQAEELTALFSPDPNVLDGRWSNNAWLQELPKPLTKLTWDNAALVSPQLAARLGLENGDVVAWSAGELSLEAPVWIMPGQADSCVNFSLGYGRTHAGSVGDGHGYDAYDFRTTDALWRRDKIGARKLGRRYPLVSTQHHFTMEGRDPVRVVTPDAADRKIEAPIEQAPSLYPEWKRDLYAWGMVIDLGTCLGCNACVVACQAENNIPVVGKEQVARGREMHWLRVDRYFEGEPENPRLLHQPVPCMQCENAPCELVCPVQATTHSSEGLNDMVYNRCVGTRYCSNNCPYKVRRFNFLDYREPSGSPVYLQKNPNVTVRQRGVMEKCTYCVQRINEARITAEKENRLIRDGEAQTACQQACPAEAIVFGNLNDSASRVVRRKSEPINYHLLAELNTRPRTSYLAKVRPPGAAPLPS